MKNARQLVGVGLFASVLVVAGFLTWVELTSSFDTNPEYLIPVLIGATVGLVLSIRVPENNIGILLLVAVLAMTGLGAGDVIMDWGLANGYVTLPIVASLVNDTGWAALMVSVFVLLPIWFPDGTPINRWSRWVARSAAIIAGLAIAGFWFAEEVCVSWPAEVCLRYEPNPWGIPGWDGTLLEPLLLVAVLLAIPAMISAGIRWRRSYGASRQQLKWFVFAASATILLLLLTLIWTPPQAVTDIGAVVMYSGLWLSIGFAVLKYRLYDLDRIISRTLAYTLVVATLSIAYLAVILGVGALATALSPTDADLPIPIVAAALVAIGFQPVRKRALRLADRLVFGKERTPYEALAGIKEVELDQLLPQIAQLVTESTAARGAVVWMSTGTELEPAAVFPDGSETLGPIILEDGQIPPSSNSGEVFPLLYQRSLLGAITTVMDSGEELPAVDVRLVNDLASHAATTINGVLEATPLPDGIVTFLMTDIEGSTNLWEEDPERMAVALRKHDELAQRLIREGGGVLVKWKGEGDSTFSVFTDPGEAVEAAMSLQQAIRDHPWDLVRPISIRAALYTGEAELRERDYYGQTVNRCARIRSLVHGGQTLVSAATRELARSATQETLTYIDLGEHQLRGFQEPERVYEVIIQTETGPIEPKQAAGI